MLDHVISSHAAYNQLKRIANDKNTSVYTVLEDVLERLIEESKEDHVAFLTRDLHVYPDFHGNR